MKRTPLRRKSKKKAASDRIGHKLRMEHLAEHDSCANCKRSWREFGVIIEVHHLMNGQRGRREDRRNYLTLCRDCHERLDKNHVAECLWLKRQSDPENYDADWLAEVYRGKSNARLPEPKEPKR